LTNLKDKKSLDKNIIWHQASITKEDRKRLNTQEPVIIWFTGLSASGKSTLAHALDEALFKKGLRSYVLDGDNIRHGLNKDLGFSDADRTENIRRIGEVAKLFLDAGLIVLTAFISPFKKDREIVRNLVGDNEFIEVFVNCPLEICEQRDPKGLYKKARLGEVKNFTGIDSDYENPDNPEIILETGKLSLEESIGQLLAYLAGKGIING
jgi:adenylylsulfate kinase